MSLYLYQYTNTIEWNISDIIFFKCFNIKILSNKFQTVQKLQLPNVLVTLLHLLHAIYYTPCLASPQPQMSYPRAGPPTPSLIHMVELEFVGLWNNPRRIFAQLQKLGVKLART